jgi:hypothetical protein
MFACMAGWATAPAAGQLATETPSSFRFVPPGHPACALELRSWAVGGSTTGLPVFGTNTVRTAPIPVGANREVRERVAAALLDRPAAIGGSFLASHGPILASATVDRGTPEAPDYVYPGPREADDGGGAPVLMVSAGRGTWALVVDGRFGRDRHPIRASAGVEGDLGRIVAGFLDARSGPTCSDGLVLGGGGVVRGVEASQRRPWRLPVVGPVRLGLQVGVLDEAGPGNLRPFFHAMRIEFTPVESVVVGMSRAVIFGGSATTVPVTPRTLALLLAGLTDVPGKDSDFENQVAAVDLRVRGRITGRPLLATLEYAADDSGWAFLEVPGLRGTASVEAGPGGPWLGIEAVQVAGSDKGYPPWYRHGALAWGWTDRGRPLGNPLGGHGWAALATLLATTRESVVQGALGVVHRGSENLFSSGRSHTGVRTSTSILAYAGPAELSLTGVLERIGVWSGRLEATLVWRLGLGARQDENPGGG